MQKKKMMALLLAAVMALAGLSGCGSDSVSNNSTVFKIGKQSCSLSEAKILLVNYQNQYRDVYGVDLFKASGEENLELETYIKDLTVSQLAEIYMMAYIGKEQDLELSEEELDNIQAAAEAYYGSLNDTEKEYFGASEKEIAALYEKYAMARKVFSALTETVDQEVSDDDARVMSVMQIYTTSEDNAKKAYKKIKGGSNFSAVAATYDESGTINTTVDRSDFSKEVEEELFSLSNEEYSSVIGTENGYYIFYIVNNFEEQLTQENKDDVLAQRMEAAVKDTYEAYSESTNSKINSDVWNQVRVNTDEALTTTSFFDVFEEHCGADYQ